MDVSVERVAPSALSPQCTELASKWLGDCLPSHKTCKGDFSSAGGGGSLLPTRLIDIGDDNDVHPPRLVISSDGSTGDYIALSHCWGGHQPLTTTTATLAARQAAIPLASMPLTFQHALLVTRKLGFRHIWIDSLCIIQDSRSGWKEQAAKMQHVYEGAILTIAADAGNKNSASGLTCADKRQRFRGVGLNGEAVRAAPAAMSGETPAHFVKWTAKVPTRQEDEGSALQTRGWTFQERVLARRVLHFGEYEMAWECAASIACECGGGRSGWKGWARHDTMYNARWCADASPLLVQNGGASVDFSQRWMAIVNKYSVRDLTYSSDKLVALAGLAARAASCSACDYLAGHWRQDLETTLLWTSNLRSCKDGEDNTVSRDVVRDVDSILSGPRWHRTPASPTPQSLG